MSVLQISFSGPRMAPQLLSFSRSLASSSSESSYLFLNSKLARLSLRSQPAAPKTTTICMGGGPRTYPGGVSKWEWKRMHLNRSKKLLKARLARERQIYLMRKKAEQKAAVSELERPWEVAEGAPNLFSVRAKEQVKMLAERFQRPDGYDMWTDQDGPEQLRKDDEAPSTRVFPEGTVHGVKPYSRVDGSEALDSKRCKLGNGYDGNGDEKVSGRQLREKGVKFEIKSNSSGSRNVVEPKSGNGKIGKPYNGKLRNRRNREYLGHDRQVGSNNSKGSNAGQAGYNRKHNLGYLESEVYDTSLQGDGSYGLGAKSDQNSAERR